MELACSLVNGCQTGKYIGGEVKIFPAFAIILVAVSPAFMTKT